MRALFSAVLFAVLPMTAQALEPFNAEYTADWQAMPMAGSAIRTLENNGQGIWTLHFRAAMLVAQLNEDSRLQIQNGQVMPLSYRYERTGMGKNKSVAYDFNWQNQTVSGHYRNDPINIPLKRGILDKSSYQLALQLDVAAGKKTMSYQVVDGNKLITQDFRVLGTEVINTGAGSLKAVHVERVRENNTAERRTDLWFAPEWDYLLVQLVQRETDGKEYQIKLQKGRVGNRTVIGQ